MAAEQIFESVTIHELLEKVSFVKAQGYRLVQIGAARLPEQLELTYSFDLDGSLFNLRLSLPVQGAKLPSITSVFWCAFLYENELHDLFEVEIEGLAVDFHGNLYRTSVKFPFGSTKAPNSPAAVSAAGMAQTSNEPVPAPHAASNHQ